MKDQNQNLCEQLEALEQYGKKNIEFHGISNEILMPGKSEKINEKIKLLLKVGYQLNISDISASHMLKTKHPNQLQPIIMRFTNRNVRNKIFALKSLFHPRKFDYKQSGIPGLARLYVNENLTSQRKNLLFETKNLAKECNPPYAFVWTSNCEILVKQNNEANSKMMKINSKKDLSIKLKGQKSGE